MNAKQRIVRSIGLANTALLKTHWPLFFTLTYRDGEEWQSSDISNFIDNYRVFIKRKLKNPKYKLTCVWTAENHEDRDYIHYHGVIWIPNGILPPKPDTTERTRKPWWPHGSSNVQRARNPAIYIAKYIGKSLEPLKLPKRARTYSINVRSLMDISYLSTPGWLQYFSRFGDKIRRVKGWGWVNFTTQRAYTSPWKERVFSKKLVWVGWKDSPPEAQYFKYENKVHRGENRPSYCHRQLTALDLFTISVGESFFLDTQINNSFSPQALGLS